MKNKTLISIVIILGIVLAASISVYFIRQNKQAANAPKNTVQQNQNNTSVPNENKPASSPAKPAENRYEGEDFSIAIPEGWTKSQQPLSGTLLTLYKIGESHTDDPSAQKINFKSYIAISFDKTQGKTLSQILDITKQVMLQTLPNAKIDALPQETIDNQKADLIEISLTQMDVNFKVLVVVVIKGDKYFSISANTTEKKWAIYKEDFYKIFKSMILKDSSSSSPEP